MPFSIATEHLQFFQQNSKIEFENLLNLNQLKSIKTALLKAQFDPGLSSGFDLWRQSPALKESLSTQKLAKLVGQLKNMTEVRFGFSQYLSANCFDNDYSLLAKRAPIRPLVCGACFCIEPAKEPESPFFPQQANSILFFDIDHDFFIRFPKTTGQYLFFFYTSPVARFYSENTEDYLEREFKKLGYHHGEPLLDHTHPVTKHIVL